MILTEIHGDLFSAPHDCFFAHCISGDYALGAGIAKTFEAKYGLRQKLQSAYPIPKRFDTNTAIKAAMSGKLNSSQDCYKDATYRNYIGRALLIDHVFNLVTKERYWMKPDYPTLRLSLQDMKRQCVSRRVKKLAMPKIGCGLDKLNWEYVKKQIVEVFGNMDIEITVYSL